MAARQRLRAALDARRASPCWRCALNPPRYNSTSSVGDLDTSKSTDGVPLDLIFPGLQDSLKSDAGPVSRILYKSRVASMQAAHKPCIRVILSGRPVALGSPFQSQSMEVDYKPRIRIAVDDRPVACNTPSQSESMEVDHKPRIRLISDGRPMACNTPSQSESMKVDHKPRIRETLDGRPTQASFRVIYHFALKKVSFRRERRRRVTVDGRPMACNTPSQSESMKVDHKPRFRGALDGRPTRTSFRIKKHLRTFFHIKKYVAPKKVSFRRRRVMVDGRPEVLITRTSLRFKKGGGLRKVSCRPKHKLDASEVPSKFQREDDDFHDALTSLLDVFRGFPTSKLPTPTREIKEPISSTRFPPRPRLNGRASFSGSRTLNRQAPIRHYATATVSK